MRFHESTRGIGLCRLFRKAGFHVWKVDENYTSKRCHGCKVGDCAPFRLVKNPRGAVARAKRPTVIRWGLTRCDACGRLWDRDVNSAQNILWAAASHLVHNAGRPAALAPLTSPRAQDHRI
jgi:transposase